MTVSRLQLQIAAKKAEQDRQRALEAAGIAPDAPERLPVDQPRTFIHTTAGANTILPDGRRLDFLGPRNGVGEYTTSNADEIEWLESLAATRTSQVSERIEDPATHVQRIVGAPADPSIQQAAEDAAKNSARANDPTLTALADNLGAVVAQQ